MFSTGEAWAQKSKFLTLYAMPQRTMILNKEETNSDIIKTIPTYSASYALFFAQTFNSWLGIEYGVCLARQEQKFQIFPYKGGDPIFEGRKRLLYVKVPLFLRAQLVTKPKNIVFVSGGPQLTVLMSEDGVIPLYTGPVEGVANDTIVVFDIAEAAGAYKKLGVDLSGSLGWQTKVYKNFFLEFRVRADYSLNDIENKSYAALYRSVVQHNLYYVYSAKRPATHNISVGLGVGLCWKIR